MNFHCRDPYATSGGRTALPLGAKVQVAARAVVGTRVKSDPVVDIAALRFEPDVAATWVDRVENRDPGQQR